MLLSSKTDLYRHVYWNCLLGQKKTRESTFDQLQFDFCVQHALNPLTIIVGSEGRTVAILEEQNLLFTWQDYHSCHAKLRLLSKVANLQLAETVVAWDHLWS